MLKLCRFGLVPGAAEQQTAKTPMALLLPIAPHSPARGQAQTLNRA
jgi:hypothetical protein